MSPLVNSTELSELLRSLQALWIPIIIESIARLAFWVLLSLATFRVAKSLTKWLDAKTSILELEMNSPPRSPKAETPEAREDRSPPNDEKWQPKVTTNL